MTRAVGQIVDFMTRNHGLGISPYVRFFVSSLVSAVFLFAVVVLARLLTYGLVKINIIIPLMVPPEDATGYLPFPVTRMLATVLDVAAVLTFVIVVFHQMIKLIRELWSSSNDDKNHTQ